MSNIVILNDVFYPTFVEQFEVCNLHRLGPHDDCNKIEGWK
jgi:hypothetical protein